jgi:FG-GAP-like repeat
MFRTRTCALLSLLAVPTFAFGSKVYFANHSFQPCSGCGATAYQHADFNSDAYEDLVWLSAPATFTVQLSDGNSHGESDGQYLPGTNYTIPDYNGSFDAIGAIALGDFSHSGSIDIVAFGVDSGNAYLYHNNGKGVFTPAGSFAYGPSGGLISSVSAVTADFNRDGNFDLAVVENGQLRTWLGNGKGGFTSGPSQGVNGANIALGDFDGDGVADLLVYRDVAAISSAYVYYGDGKGNFPQSITLSLPGGYASFSTGDVNSDGRTDVMATDPFVAASRVFVFYGDAGRTFASRTSILVGRCVTDGPAQVADMDGNLLNYLVVTETDCGNPSEGALYVDVLTRNLDSSYNPDQTVYWAKKGTDGSTYGVDQPPVILRGDQDSTPDLIVQQCSSAQCQTVYNTTMLNTTGGPSFPACLAPFAAEGIIVCNPVNSETIYSPVSFEAAAAGPVPMRDMEVWVDGQKKGEEIYGYSYYTYLNRSVTLTPGSHQVTIVAAGWDQSVQKKSFTITVH